MSTWLQFWGESGIHSVIKFLLHLPHVRQQIGAADVRCVNGALCPQGHLCLDSWTGFAHVLNQASPHDLACELCIDSWTGFAHVLNQASPHDLACELCNLTLEWCFSLFLLFHFSYLSAESVTFRIIWIPLKYVKVSHSCPTLRNPVNCSLLCPSVHGILQARVLGWVASSFSKGSSQPRDWTRVSCNAGVFFSPLYMSTPPHLQGLAQV